MLGGKVKILSSRMNLDKREDQVNLDALKRVERVLAEVKVHSMLHADRSDGQLWGVIVGSGDIKSDCLGGRRFDAVFGQIILTL